MFGSSVPSTARASPGFALSAAFHLLLIPLLLLMRALAPPIVARQPARAWLPLVTPPQPRLKAARIPAARPAVSPRLSAPPRFTWKAPARRPLAASKPLEIAPRLELPARQAPLLALPAAPLPVPALPVRTDVFGETAPALQASPAAERAVATGVFPSGAESGNGHHQPREIGRASCRERV